MKLIVFNKLTQVLLFAFVVHNTSMTMSDHVMNADITKELIKNYREGFKKVDSDNNQVLSCVWNQLVAHRKQQNEIKVIKFSTQIIGTRQALRKCEVRNTDPMYIQKIFLALRAAAQKSRSTVLEVDDYSWVDTNLEPVSISSEKNHQAWMMTCYTRLKHKKFLKLLAEIEQEK